MLPDMSDVLTEWSQSVTLRTITKSTVDFELVEDIVDQPLQAVIQVADKEKLNIAEVDWSLRYIQAHSKVELFVGQAIVYNGDEYKIITDANYSDYGFSDVFAEEMKTIQDAEIPQ